MTFSFLLYKSIYREKNVVAFLHLFLQVGNYNKLLVILISKRLHLLCANVPLPTLTFQSHVNKFTKSFKRNGCMKLERATHCCLSQVDWQITCLLPESVKRRQNISVIKLYIFNSLYIFGDSPLIPCAVPRFYIMSQ